VVVRADMWLKEVAAARRGTTIQHRFNRAQLDLRAGT
jgi:hypothetical protein